MDHMIGTDNEQSRIGKAILKSITLTAGAAATSLLIHPLNTLDTTGDIVISSPADTTVQIPFSGIGYEYGFTVTPNAGTICYVLEYDA